MHLCGVVDDADAYIGKKSVFQAVKSIRKSKVRNIAVNSDEYLKLDPSQIPEEEKFFYK